MEDYPKLHGSDQPYECTIGPGEVCNRAEIDMWWKKLFLNQYRVRSVKLTTVSKIPH